MKSRFELKKRVNKCGLHSQSGGKGAPCNRQGILSDLEE